MNIAIVGNGKMGRMLDEVCAERDDVRLIGHVGPGAFASLDELEGLSAALELADREFGGS